MNLDVLLWILGGGFAGTWGLTLFFMNQCNQAIRGMDKKIDENRKETNSILNGIQNEVKSIQQEMKDFHGRMERQDAEFKAHLMYSHSDKQVIIGK